MEAGGAPGAQGGDRAHDEQVAGEKYRVDREPHEEGVDRRARLDEQRLALRQPAPAEQPAHAPEHGGGPLDANGERRAGPGISQDHVRTRDTRGPRPTLSRPVRLE